MPLPAADGAADGDSLDEAVKMLRAQTEPGSAAHASVIHANGANRGAGGRPQLHPSVPAQPALQVKALHTAATDLQQG